MKKRILKFKSNTDTDSSLNNNQTGNQQNIQFESNYKNLNHAQPKEVNFNQMHEKQINTSNTMQVKSAHLQKHNNKKQFERSVSYAGNQNRAHDRAQGKAAGREQARLRQDLHGPHVCDGVQPGKGLA